MYYSSIKNTTEISYSEWYKNYTGNSYPIVNCKHKFNMFDQIDVDFTKAGPVL